jgi:hypothetical protein
MELLNALWYSGKYRMVLQAMVLNLLPRSLRGMESIRLDDPPSYLIFILFTWSGLWNWMKNYLQANFPEHMALSELRIALREAWDAIPPDFLQDA